MSDTYTGDFENPIEEVRFLIQDTDEDSFYFSDLEIAYALGATDAVPRRAAIALVERLMARFAGMADTTELDLSVRASQLYDHYKDLYTSLRNSFGGPASAVPYAGGISYSDIEMNEANTNRVTGMFSRRRRWRFESYGGRWT